MRKGKTIEKFEGFDGSREKERQKERKKERKKERQGSS